MIKSSPKSSLFTMLSVIALIGLAQVSCGGESESNNIDFKPEKNPLAINADITIGSGDDEVKLKGPWYLFRYSVKNNSKSTLYLVTIRAEISSIKNGVRKTGTITIDPGENCADGLSRPFLGIIGPGVHFSGYDWDGSVGKPLSHCDVNLPLNPEQGEYEGIYFHGLPESNNLIYSVTLIGEGWFEKDGVITERAYIRGFQVTK